MALVDAETRTLEPHHLRLTVEAPDDHAGRLDFLPLGGQTLDRIKRVAIRQTLAQAEGNKLSAARTLGIAVSTLYEKLKKYGL